MITRSLFALCTIASISVRAQEDVKKEEREAAEKAMAARAAADTTGKIWTTSGVFQVNLTQVSLTNWAAGGFNSLGGIALFNGAANRVKGRTVWENSLILGFGGQLQSDQGYSFDEGVPLKTEDRIELNTKWGYEIKKPWYFATLAQFKTQFTEGFDATGTRISHLLAPAYLIVGVGFDYRPSDRFTLFLSPATMKLTIVTDETLWGDSIDPELRVYGVKNGETTDFGLGGYIRAQFQTDPAKNITFLTRADLFSNYLREPENIDVTWEMLWTFKVNDWFAATLNTMLIYDHDIDVPRVKEVEGVKVIDPGPGTQFKETLGIGLTLKL